MENNNNAPRFPLSFLTLDGVVYGTIRLTREEAEKEVNGWRNRWPDLPAAWKLATETAPKTDASSESLADALIKAGVFSLTGPCTCDMCREVGKRFYHVTNGKAVREASAELGGQEFNAPPAAEVSAARSDRWLAVNDILPGLADEVPDWASFLAQDFDGSWWAFDSLPKATNEKQLDGINFMRWHARKKGKMACVLASDGIADAPGNTTRLMLFALPPAEGGSDA